MTVSLKNIGALTLFVEDVQRAKPFYGEILGLNLIFEDENSAVYDLGNTVINLLNDREAPELIAPAPVATRGSGSRVMLTIWVDDTDAAIAEVQGRGGTLLNGPIDRPWGMRTACIADPDGHIWEFAQDLSKQAKA
jgi:catechol 2,3-dioxygenase-like lactoylglutathione lyase family enzyme